MKLPKKIAFVIALIINTTYVMSQCEENSNVWNDSWTSCDVSPNPNTVRGNSHWLLYEFDEEQVVEDIYVWNANKIGESHLGVKDVVIDYSVDGVNWIEVGSYIFPQADESDSYEGFEGAVLEGILAKKILITCLTNYNSDDNDCVSLSEIQFKIGEKDDDGGVLSIVYPNPIITTTTIETLVDSMIYVYDLTGKFVFSQKITHEKEVIDLSTLSSGIYFGEVIKGTYRSRIKLIKE